MIVLMTFVIFPVQANSAQKDWYGVDSMGTIVIGEDCPIEVKKEVLTFDISEFPSNYYLEKEDYLAYSGKVTAEYTFYNPTDLTITATLAFPFGNRPDYYLSFDDGSDDYDISKYDITINGKAVERTIRYTWNNQNQFNISTDLPKISDEYLETDLYKPSTIVTKYSYDINNLSYNGQVLGSFNAAFDWDGGEGQSIIWFPSQSGVHLQDDGDYRLSKWARNGDSFEVYVIGTPLSTPLVWKCYKDGGVEDREEISGSVSLKTTETMILEDLFCKSWSEETGVLKVDWYNASLNRLVEATDSNYHYITTYSSPVLSRNNLMRWYQYEITIEPKTMITNTVTAPLYPDISARYQPPVYQYTYLLSPASTWSDFKNLEIVINTPFYIIESSLEGFTKTEKGYEMSFEKLPEAELIFTLCSDEHPIKEKTPYFNNVILWIVIIIISFIAVVVGICVLIGIIVVTILIVKKVKKNKK